MINKLRNYVDEFFSIQAKVTDTYCINTHKIISCIIDNREINLNKINNKRCKDILNYLDTIKQKKISLQYYDRNDIIEKKDNQAFKLLEKIILCRKIKTLLSKIYELTIYFIFREKYCIELIDNTYANEDLFINNKLFDLKCIQMSKYFLEELCKAKAVTKKKYRKLLERVNEYIGDKKIQELTVSTLHDMYYKHLIKGSKKEKIKNSTLLEYYKIVSLVLNKAVDYQLLSSNPNLRVVRPKKEIPDVNVYDVEDVIKLLSCLENENLKWKTIITLAIVTGCRRGELCALKYSNIDFEKKVLTIENSLKVVDGKPYTDGPKTKNAHRKIPLGDVIIKVLQEYKKWQDSYIKVMGNKWEENDYVFPSKYGRYMHPDSYNTMLSRIVTKYKLKPISFHGLRHTSCSILVNNNINSRTIIDRMGQSEELFMLLTYAKSFDESHIQSAKIFDEVLSTVINNGT